MKGTNEASKEGLKGRPGNLKRWAGGQGMTQKQERKVTKEGKGRHKSRQVQVQRQAKKGRKAGKEGH